MPGKRAGLKRAEACEVKTDESVKMSERGQVYKCEECGDILQVLTGGSGDAVCCGKGMELLEEKSEDEGLEKHVPVVEETEGGVRVKVGSVEHPMEEKHHIAWIEVLSGDKSYRQFLNPGDSPEAEFCLPKGGIDRVREHCNIHGLWASE